MAEWRRETSIQFKALHVSDTGIQGTENEKRWELPFQIIKPGKLQRRGDLFF